MRQMESDGTRLSDVLAHAASVALWTQWPEAPGPFKFRESASSDSARQEMGPEAVPQSGNGS
jgi:hypothetical protein